MGGGLMELVAYGAQDIYLTGNPQITFFKVVYRRHTNFSMESIEQTWLGNDITESETTPGKCESIITRDGDLIYRMYLELTVSNPGSETDSTVGLVAGAETINNISKRV